MTDITPEQAMLTAQMMHFGFMIACTILFIGFCFGVCYVVYKALPNKRNLKRKGKAIKIPYKAIAVNYLLTAIWYFLRIVGLLLHIPASIPLWLADRVDEVMADSMWLTDLAKYKHYKRSQK